MLTQVHRRVQGNKQILTHTSEHCRADKLIQDIMKARTASEFQVVIEDAAPVNHDLDANPQLVWSAEPPSSLAQLIIRPGESGRLLTPTEF